MILEFINSNFTLFHFAFYPVNIFQERNQWLLNINQIKK